MEQKARNEENIKAVTDALFAAGYHSGRMLYGKHRDGTKLEFFIGPGRVSVIAVEYYDQHQGFEIFVPLVATNRMDETLSALRAATGKSGQGLDSLP